LDSWHCGAGCSCPEGVDKTNSVWYKEDTMMKCSKCKKELDEYRDVIVNIRIEYPRGPTFTKEWCLSCYLKKGE
jgi:hypothetical protein